MYAVIKSGGKQYRVSQGEVIRLEQLAGEVGAEITLDKILLISQKNETILGNPMIENATVSAKILSHGREKKITVIKFRRRKDSKLKQGHRQYYTEIEVTGIHTSSTESASTKIQKDQEPKKASKKAEKKPVETKTEGS